MGCRPSRRAVACVRVAGEGGGPWGVGRSHHRPHPLHSVGDGVRLRRRSLQRRNGDIGGGEGVGCNPRDRYSAPPMDRQFPPHSCTSATYEHGRCKGTSRITLRLSKNGSTLEIEKCDFQHDRSTCPHCGPETSSEDSNHIASLLRTQSAPNLSISASPSSNSICPPPRPPRHTKRQEVDVDVETLPPPLPPRHRESLSVGRVDAEADTPAGSVRTATRVDVNLESLCPSPQSSEAWAISDSIEIDVDRDYLSSNETDSSDCVRVDIHAQNSNEPCGLQEKVVLVLPDHAASGNTEYVHFPCCHARDSSLAPTLNFMENVVKSERNNSLPNHRVLARELVDLTAFHSTNSHVMPSEADFDVDCLVLGSQNQRLRKPAHDTAACKERGFARLDNCASDMRCLRPAHFTEDIDGISVSSASSDYRSNKRQTAAGATDYRILMLGAGCSEITSHLTSGDVQGASDARLLSSDVAHTSQLIQGMKVTRTMHDAASNGSQFTSSASDSSRQDRHSDESTDTGCESDEEGERSQLLARLEMAPTYVHADFKNDFGDLFDDSSPGLDAS